MIPLKVQQQGLIRILRILNSSSENKSKIIYFKKLLDYVLKEKQQEKKKETKVHAI
ncbi:hypothetical protein SAMN04488573_12911 [Bacillus sp. 5mfcol3.1]|nr:hypothetical protein SAMN04488573_12911 [Bacillus sp. 5mfcol3.1]